MKNFLAMMITLQGINISHMGKRKIIFKMPFLVDMLVPWRVLHLKFELFLGVFPFSAFYTNEIFRPIQQQQIVLQQKNTMEVAFLLRKPFKEPEHSRKPLMASKNDSISNKEKMQLIGS